MALFLSTFTNKLDKKGRVSVPAPFRIALAQESFSGIILFRSYKVSALEGCALSRMEHISKSMDNLDMFSDTQDDLTATIFADSHQLPFDSDGRVLLPSALIEHTAIADQVAFVGRGNTFQIWHPQTFQAHQKQARERAARLNRTLNLNQTVRAASDPEGAAS